MNLTFVGVLLLAQDPQVEELLKTHPSGLFVIVGAEDGALAAKIAEGGRRIVHVLAADETTVRDARRKIEERGLYGLAAVEPWSGTTLPYAENLVNVLLCTAPLAEARSEEHTSELQSHSFISYAVFCLQ